jgi:Putative  PD-(D/E)XK family member, (DUF4420)
MNRADVEATWSAVDQPTTVGDLSGKPAPELDPSLGALLAVDHHGLRHLLIPATPDSKLPRQVTTKGLEVTLDELRVGGRSPGRYFDVACQDSSANANFTAVGTEILEALKADHSNVAEMLSGILDRWRWFWGVPPNALSAEEAVGLFGELWFLEFWLDPIDTAVLEAWTGPTGDRHDLKWSAASVEIKATRARADGAATHRISALDQLEDPYRGQLYLFSLRATPDPIAANSLNESVDRIRAKLSGKPAILQKFDERLGLVGYSPAHRQHYGTPLRVTAEELYRVDADFPRLTKAAFPDGVPNGVDDIAYTLDLVACARWKIAIAPGPESRDLRSSLR